MFRYFAIPTARIAAACLISMLSVHGLAQETGPDRKAADAESATNFERSSEESSAAKDTEIDEPIDFDSKRPSILGMTVVEDDDGRPLVVDVGASTPSWDAGIRKDDVILALHGVEAKSFQEWADSVRKVVADAKAGQTIPVQIRREGAPLDLQVRISEQKGVTPPRPIGTQPTTVVQNQIQPAGEQPIQPGVGPYPVGGGGVGVGPVVFDSGAGGRSAGDQAPIHAAAQLMAVNNRAGTAPAPAAPLTNNPTNAAGQGRASNGTAPGTFPGNPTNPTGAAPGTGGVAPGTFPNNNRGAGSTGNENVASGQVGVAEFADHQSGMLAVVTLRGLPPGNYRVGIGEFNNGGIGEPNTPMPDRVGNRSQQFGDRDRAPGVQPPGTQPQPVPPVPSQAPQQPIPTNRQPQPGVSPAPAGQPAPSTPRGAGGTSGAGGSGAGNATNNGASIDQSTFYVLAQVTSGAGNPQLPNSGTTRNAAAGTAPPTIANPTGQVGNPNLSRRLPTQPGVQQPNTAVGTGGQFRIELGVVAVRTNGAGKLQQRLEGLRVANVVGQSVLVVPADIPVSGNARGAGSFGVVASGVIQLISSDQPTGQGQIGNQNAPVPGTAQGSATTQPVPSGASATQQVPAQTPVVPPDRNQR